MQIRKFTDKNYWGEWKKTSAAKATAFFVVRIILARHADR